MIISAAKRLDHVSEYYFAEKLEEIRRMRGAGHDVINLGIGSPDLAPSQESIEAAAKALKLTKNHGYAPYRSNPELRRAICDWYAATYSVMVDPDANVLPLLGSKEGIFYVSMAFLNPGDKALVPNPGYPAYSAVTNLVGAVSIPYDLTAESGWEPDFEKLAKTDLTGCKLMWVNYPHMPTGKAASRALFEKLARFGKERGILICHDNPYGLVLNSGSPLSLLAADSKLESCLELNSFSKSFNMAGWRIGMLLAAKDIVDTVLKVKSNVDSGMFIPLQEGAIAALKNPGTWHQERNRIYAERRAHVWKIFDHLGFQYSRDQVGMFVWAKAPQSIKDVTAFVDKILNERHVFLTPGFIFGTNGERFMRASLCAPAERISEAAKRLREFGA